MLGPSPLVRRNPTRQRGGGEQPGLPGIEGSVNSFVSAGREILATAKSGVGWIINADVGNTAVFIVRDFVLRGCPAVVGQHVTQGVLVPVLGVKPARTTLSLAAIHSTTST